MADDDLLFTVEDGIATVTLNRPHACNALSVAMCNRLTALWEAIDRRADIRVVVLTATDCGTFCAGMDLKEAAAIRHEQGVDVLTLVRDPFHARMRSVEVPIVAAVTGHFMAGGMLLALNADLRVGLAGTRAGITEVRVGRGSPWAVPLLWMLPQAIVMQMVLTGETMPVEVLAAHGFFNGLANNPDTVRDHARTLAESIQMGAPLSVNRGKAALNAATSMGCDAGLANALRLYQAVYASDDAEEGPRAFAAKRAPRWQGR